jgi:dipeptidyl aminopeptidase/acylaminoacyl peptidase
MSVKRVCRFVSVLACLWLLAWPGPVRAGSGAAGDVLAFARGGAIWLCSGDGGGRRELGPGLLPAVSPDGRFMAFFRAGGQDLDTADELWLHDLVSGGEHRLAAGIAAYSPPVWTPDGQTIAVLSRDGQGVTQIEAVGRDGSRRRILFAEGDGGSGFLCSLSPSPDGALVTHDMVAAYWIGQDGHLREKVPLETIMGSLAGGVTSSHGLAVCPTDPGLLVFGHSAPGTPRFDRVMHEPNSALSIHDRWTGKGKNMRITPPDITAFDPVWSMDGKRVYFIGYRDTQAAEADLFRIWRVERFGGGLRELTRGEDVSAGAR